MRYDLVHRAVAICVVSFAGLASLAQGQPPPETPADSPPLGTIKVQLIPNIGPAGPIKKLHTDFEFTEGPVAIGPNVYFTDIPKARIYKIDADNKLSVFYEPSGHANGLFHHRGRNQIIACAMDGKIIALARKAYSVDATPQGKGKWSIVNGPLDEKDKTERDEDGTPISKPVEVKTIADKYDGQRFNAPNDLVIDRDGGIYFTDPHFRAPMPLPQGKTCVYYVDPKGKVTRLIDDLKAPNGVILSPDEKTLYVIPSGSAEMMAYPVESPGKLGEGRVFCKLEQPEGQTNSGGDGLTVDEQGNLYITSGLGVQVFDDKGRLLGILRSPELLPEQPANCTFGGKDNKTLYITARKSVYAVPMEVAGHQFPAGEK